MKTTKELAKELGLLRKRSVSSPGQKLRNKRRKILGQIFQYIIVLDFESTCWSDTKLIPQEIIEFPAVLMNTSNGSIESEFQYYVQPQEKPMLSEFCCQLTGISQKQVDDGIPLHFCLKRFSQWLEKLYKEKNIQYFSTPEQNSNLCCFITWSDWDLGMCLKNECRRKQIRKPPELNQWIDLRATYKKFYDRKPEGLNGALKDLGITFQGREHSGLDDARNTAFLAWRMIQDGCVLTITKCLTGVPKSVGHDKPLEKCPVINEMPAFQNGDQAKNLGKNNNFRTGLCIPRSSTGQKMNTSDESKDLTRNSPPKRPKSPLQSRLLKNSNLPHTSLGPHSSIGQKMNAADKSKNLTQNSSPKKPKSPLKSRLHKNSDLTQTSMKTTFLDAKHTINNNPSVSSTATLSKSTSINTVSTSFQIQAQSNHLQLKKPFTVYTDIKNPNPKRGQPSTNDISFAQDKANISKTVNRSAIVSTPSLAVKDISNTFIIPDSLPPRKSNRAATLKYPGSNNNNPSNMKSTPPLCKCGHRAKLFVSHSPGANMGKTFFTCSMKGSSIKLKNKPVTPCNFFKWDHAHQASSISLSNQSLQSSSLSLSSFSISAKENYSSSNNSTFSLGTNSAEYTPVLKKKPVRSYRLC